MQITQNRVVGLTFEMTTEDGRLADRSGEPILYLHGHDNLLPKVEAALEGKTEGDTVDVPLSPEEGFGAYDQALVRPELKSVFPPEVKVGLLLEATDPQTGDPLLFRVVDEDEQHFVLDGNHPFAGLTLRFQGKVVSVRDATAAEIAQGHPEGI